MQNLTIINISLLDRTNYQKFAVKFHITKDFFTTVPQLQVFSVRTKGEITFSPDALQNTNHLRVLDFTRTKYLDLQSFYGSVENQNTSIETLILKNVQTLSPTGQFHYVASVDLSKIVCPLSKTLRKLDMSHNEIQSIVLSQTTGCVYWFDELDLSYNLIINIREGTDPTFYLALFSSLLGVRVIHADHMWSEDDIDSDLWKDTDDYVEGAVEERSMPSFDAQKAPIPQNMITYLPFVPYVISWLDEMKQHCPALKKDLYCLITTATHSAIIKD